MIPSEYTLVLPTIWKPLQNREFGFMRVFSDLLTQVESKELSPLPNLQAGDTLLVASDYSGQHDTAVFESYSFLITNLEKCGGWAMKSRIWRKRFLPDGRRMAFKDLNDRIRRNALPSFLTIANKVTGISVTVLVDKRIRSLFGIKDEASSEKLKLPQYKHWAKRSFERMLRIVHLISFFIAGLSRPMQDVLWFTDEDEIAANDNRIRELTKLFANIASHYLAHDMSHLRCGTTRCDDGSRQVEDLVAIPDLIAGSIGEVIKMQRQEGLFPEHGIFAPRPRAISAKASEVINWFATDRQPLKRLVFVVEPTRNSAELALKRVRFHGSNDRQC